MATFSGFMCSVAIFLHYNLHNQGVHAVGGCDDDWHRNRENCYFVCAEPSSWNFAEMHCASRGSQLTSISDVEEHTFITGIMKTTEHSAVVEFWVGLQWRGWAGSWIWVDGTTVNNNLPWMERISVASSTDPLGGSCARVVADGILDYRWSECYKDTADYRYKIGYICRKRATDDDSDVTTLGNQHGEEMSTKRGVSCSEGEGAPHTHTVIPTTAPVPVVTEASQGHAELHPPAAVCACIGYFVAVLILSITTVVLVVLLILLYVVYKRGSKMAANQNAGLNGGLLSTTTKGTVGWTTPPGDVNSSMTQNKATPNQGQDAVYNNLLDHQERTGYDLGMKDYPTYDMPDDVEPRTRHSYTYDATMNINAGPPRGEVEAPDVSYADPNELEMHENLTYDQIGL